MTPHYQATRDGLTESEQRILLMWCWAECGGDAVHASLCGLVGGILAARLADPAATDPAALWERGAE